MEVYDATLSAGRCIETGLMELVEANVSAGYGTGNYGVVERASLT